MQITRCPHTDWLSCMQITHHPHSDWLSIIQITCYPHTEWLHAYRSFTAHILTDFYTRRSLITHILNDFMHTDHSPPTCWLTFIHADHSPPTYQWTTIDTDHLPSTYWLTVIHSDHSANMFPNLIRSTCTKVSRSISQIYICEINDWLLEFYVLAAFQLSRSTMTWYPTQSHHPDIDSTSHKINVIGTKVSAQSNRTNISYALFMTCYL